MMGESTYYNSSVCLGVFQLQNYHCRQPSKNFKYQLNKAY